VRGIKTVSFSHFMNLNLFSYNQSSTRRKSNNSRTKTSLSKKHVFFISLMYAITMICPLAHAHNGRWWEWLLFWSFCDVTAR